MKGIVLIITVFISISAFGQSSIGRWLTFDDDTKEKKSIVKLYRENGKMYGKVEKVIPGKGVEENPKCDKCTGNNKNKPIEGLQIVRGLKWNNSEWTGGTILDPENGKVYDVKMWLDSDNSDMLIVRGYIGVFYRTQYWIRID